VRTVRVAAAILLAAAASPGLGERAVWAEGGNQAAPDPGRQARMRAHFDQVLVIHAAVIRGDLPAVAPAARVVAQESLPAVLEGLSPYVAAMKQAALHAAEARDVLAAAKATAAMLNACGECHRSARVTPTVATPKAPQVGGVVGHMLEHERAADQMLHGLIVPSDAAWRDGARRLVAAPLHPTELPADAEARRAMAQTEERVHRLATDAVQARDSRARAGFYAQLIAGCADCHRRR
jgi:hypothetical protein